MNKTNKNYSGVFKISNQNLISLVRWLNLINLSGNESRERTKFIQLAESRIREIEENRINIVKKYANKNDDGTPRIVHDSETEDENGNIIKSGERFDVPEESVGPMNTEFSAYLGEDWELDISDGNIAKFNTVKKIVLETTEKFSGSLAQQYDEWCKAFESVNVG